MSLNRAVILDMDDTLIFSHVFYAEAKKWLADLIEDELGIGPTQVEETMHAVEMENLPKYGYSRHRFPASLLETYRRLCRRHEMKPDVQAERILEKVGYDVYRKKAKVDPDAERVLRELDGAGYRLILYTMGDPIVQVERIKAAKLHHHFAHIYIPPLKSTRSLEVLIEDNDLDREGSWLVGDSIRNDINPAVQAGLNAILVTGRPTWHHNHTEMNSGRVWVTPHLRLVPDIVLGRTVEYRDVA